MQKITQKLISATVGFGSVMAPTAMVAMNATSAMAAEHHTYDTWTQDYKDESISHAYGESDEVGVADTEEMYVNTTYQEGQKKFNQQARAASNWYKKTGKSQASQMVYENIEEAKKHNGTVIIQKQDGKYSVTSSWSVKTNGWPGGYGVQLLIDETGHLSGES